MESQLSQLWLRQQDLKLKLLVNKIRPHLQHRPVEEVLALLEVLEVILEQLEVAVELVQEMDLETGMMTSEMITTMVHQSDRCDIASSKFSNDKM